MDGFRVVGGGWFVEYDCRSTLASQNLIFDQPGSHSDYHRGQRAEYIINAAARTVSYSDGDPSRQPSKFIVGCASETLLQLNQEGKLFTLTEAEIQDLFKCLECGVELSPKDEGYGAGWGMCHECAD